MTEKFEIIGEWFLPTDRNNRVHGTLTFDPQNGTDLELYGSLEGDNFLPEFIDQEIILGLTSDSKEVTLYNCFMSKSDGATFVSGGESGKPSTTYSIRYLLIGFHANTITDLMFTQISSEIFNLGEWIGISGFKNQKYDPQSFKNHEITINYKLPDSIDFEIDNKTKGRFSFKANQPGYSRYQKIVTINQTVEFQAISVEEKSIEDLLKFLTTFQNLLTLALYKSTYPLSISLKSENLKIDYGNGVLHKKIINLYYSSRNFKPNEKPKYDFEMIFDYKRIKDNFPIIIKNWYSKYKLLAPALNLVFEQFYNDNEFTVNTFLNLAQSAETFHARIHNHTRISREDYKKMKNDILSIVPTEYHIWLNDQFNFGNNLNLHTRLTELTEKYSNKVLDKILGDKTKFILNVKHSRNYYTHYSKDGEPKALKEVDLFYLSEKLKILLVCAFLIEIGFDRDKLSDFLFNIRWKLFSHLANWKDDEEIKTTNKITKFKCWDWLKSKYNAFKKYLIKLIKKYL